jgi:hypothetical protein
MKRIKELVVKVTSYFVSNYLPNKIYNSIIVIIFFFKMDWSIIGQRDFQMIYLTNFQTLLYADTSPVTSN